MWSAITRAMSRLISVFRHRTEDAELDQELETHRALLVDDYRRRGLLEDEARRAAHVTLGHATQLREAHRAVRGAPLLEEVLRDLRYAARGFRRQPGFTAIAILTLAVGIGANAAVSSIVHGVLMRPLAYRDPDALMLVARADQRAPGLASPSGWISLRRWDSLRAAQTFDVGLYRPAIEDAILGGREPVVLRAARISANVTDILGVRPMLGRSFRADEDVEGGASVALIGERLWSTRFSRDRGIVGRTISLSSAPYTVIGVMPADFQFPLRDVDLWLPQPASLPFLARQFHACCSPLMGVARLGPGMTKSQADAELAVLNAAYEPAGQRRVDAGPAFLAPLKDSLVGRVNTMLWMLMAAVALVLLIACANVATLLMARATAREREFALRSALGAGRGRLTRQLVTESLVLSLTGGALGFVVAVVGVRAVAAMTLVDLPRAHELGVDMTVLVWTTAIVFVTGVVFGTFPSLRLLRPAVIERLRQHGTTDSDAHVGQSVLGVSTRGVLVVVQVALSLILLIGAALMAKSIARLASVDIGFPATGLLTMRVPLPVTTYDTAEKRSRFFDQLVTGAQAIPGVRGATVVRALPMAGGVLGTNLQIASQPIPDPGRVGQLVHTVTPGYFEVVGQRVAQGRAFDARDNTTGAPGVAIVNEAFARKYWPSSSATPIGDHLMIPVVSPQPLEIVGVVGDVRQGGPTRDPELQVYLPDRLYPPQVALLALRADGDPLRTVDAIRAAVRAIDPNQSITDVQMMDAILERATGQQQLAARVLGLFAGTALLLAIIGLYGVMAYSVAQRTQEIGIRRAFGAGHREVVWMIVGQGLRVTLTGIGLGVAGAYAATRLLESLLFDVSTTDALTFAAVPIVFVFVALCASVIPALRAVQINPAGALRL